MWSVGIFPFNIFWCFFLQPQVVLSHVFTGQYSAEDSRGTFYRSSEFFLSLCAALSSAVLCLTNSSHIGFSGHLAPLPQLRKTARLCLGSSSLCNCLKTLSRQWARLIVGLTLFLLPQSPLSSIVDVQCLKTIVSYTPSGISVVSGRMINLVLITLSLLKESVSQLILILKPGKSMQQNEYIQPSRVTLIYSVA